MIFQQTRTSRQKEKQSKQDFAHFLQRLFLDEKGNLT
jgi:hypothetical protein